MSSPAVSIPAPRDLRLDVLRGLCLLNMVLVHLLEHNPAVPWAVNEVLIHWLRFAAGGFVFASGLCIGAIHYHRSLKPGKRLSTHVSLFRRAGIVLIVHYFSTLLALVLMAAYGRPILHGPQMVLDTLRFWIGMDLLVFYVLMLAASPLVIEFVRKVGVLPVMVASASIYVFSIGNPYLGLYPLEQKFPVLYWQFIYVSGICGGVLLPKFDQLTSAGKWRLFAGGMTVALGIAVLGAIQKHYDLRWHALLDASFTDFPGLEAARYMGLTIAVGVLVDRVLAARSAGYTTRTLALLGSWTLPLWVAHGPIVEYVARYPWLVASILSILGVWVAAKISEWFCRQWDGFFRSLPRLSYAAPVLGVLLMSLMLVVLNEEEQFVDNSNIDESPLFMRAEELDELQLREPIPVDFDSIVLDT